MSSDQILHSKPGLDNRVLPQTRWVAALVIPFLVLAFVILFFVPNQTGQRFAWEIKPPMTAAFMGTGYLGGAYFFARVAAAFHLNDFTRPLNWYLVAVVVGLLGFAAIYGGMEWRRRAGP
jgi:hypothetical protein